MDAYELPLSLLFQGFRALWGVPLYGVVRLGAADTQPHRRAFAMGEHQPFFRGGVLFSGGHIPD